jgi:hypothetical protein
VRDQLGAELKVDLDSGSVHSFARQNGTLTSFAAGGAMVMVEACVRSAFEQLPGTDPLRRRDHSPIDLARELLDAIVAKGMHLAERRGMAATFRNLAHEYDEHALSLSPPVRNSIDYAERAHVLLARARDRELLIKVDLLSERLIAYDQPSEQFAIFASDGRTLRYGVCTPSEWRLFFGVGLA